ncbi:DoxX family protein [Spirosoma sp. KUDC1026]|uniref:DoxX family protein n=1 Tax=Spirosoma sp. KUDC1026 TaxID=2745947 RepID=UPI00159BB1D2|nr:DoxX family protein [Spirosoma sp. KUDC1026]QKZ13212.1 DoxX family protein [Spirosoma sp. KUDC1026]
MNTSLVSPWPSASAALNGSSLLLRLTFGVLMIPHGYAKLVHFSEWQNEFMSFLGMSGAVSLSLAIFAELVCSVLLILGLFTRLALIPLIITTLVIVFSAHEGDIFGDAAPGFFYLTGYVVLLLVGPGRYSLDNLLFTRSTDSTKRLVA